MDGHYRIVGGLGSPYSMKMRAVFRYRRLPHIFEMRNGTVREETSQVRPQIIPMVRGPDDESWMVDSTCTASLPEVRSSTFSSLDLVIFTLKPSNNTQLSPTPAESRLV